MDLVSAGWLARLACCLDDRPYVVPIHYVADRSVLYSFTMPGRKLDIMRSNPFVCLEIDAFESGSEWRSVVVEGTFRALPNEDGRNAERLHAWDLLQSHVDWWEPGALKPKPMPVLAKSPHVFFAIDIAQMSGRHAITDA
jgi:nitroimidazol reductase NimA-like FMN-containing flavoprotein (pyridoxamine 5'-phosphate oxidase superfamily)